MPDLYAFDGNNKPYMVNRIEVNYHRITKIKPKVPISEHAEYAVWDYTESLIVDRESESIEHIQNIGSGCSVIRKYKVEGGVESLLEDMDAESIFNHIEGNPENVVVDPLETIDYTIKVISQKGNEKLIQGTYDKKGLPDDWAEFMESIFEFMSFYGWGEIMNPSVYGKVRRCDNDIIYCSVEFEDGYKSYYYISDDDTIEVGDFVLVPAGKDNHEAGNEIILPFKNLINDSYSRDISIKIRSNLETKRRNGEFVGSHVVYGYRRSDDDKNKLVIDQTVAPVIQSIFSMKMDGFSPAQIADKLNKDGVPSPYEYKRQSGSKYQSGFKKQIQTDWGAKAIYRILKNEMYTGTLVQGKTTTPNHKIKSRTTKDEADWMRTENAHDAIISPSIFDMVQKLMLEDTRSPSGDNSVHLFSGKVFCADCQSTMTRKKTKSAGKEYVYFVCNANKVDRKVCDAHTVKEQVVYDAALAVIQAQVSLALNLEIALGKLNGISWERREMERIASKIARQEEVVEHNKQMKAHVYEDFKTEMITREEYFIFKAEFDKNIQEAKEAIARLVGNKNQISSGLTEQQSWLAQFKEYENIQELNRRVVVNFIDRIEITEDKQVHVVLNNADQFQAIMEFLEEEKAKANAKKVISFIREVS